MWKFLCRYVYHRYKATEVWLKNRSAVLTWAQKDMLTSFLNSIFSIRTGYRRLKYRPMCLYETMM